MFVGDCENFPLYGFSNILVFSLFCEKSIATMDSLVITCAHIYRKFFIAFSSFSSTMAGILEHRLSDTASFPCLPTVQFLIACSMINWGGKAFITQVMSLCTCSILCWFARYRRYSYISVREKTFLQVEIFATWRSITKIAKISRYTVIQHLENHSICKCT